MINPLALKVGLGGAVATTAGTVGIVYKDKIKDFFAQLSSKSSTFIVVKATRDSDSNIDKDLYDRDGKTKNFKCIVTTNNNLEDDNCDLLEITAPQTNKLNNLKEIKDSTTKATKDKIKTNTFFKLTISDSVLGAAWDGTQTIDIVSKTEDSNTKKKYGSFTLQYKVLENDEKVSVTGKTNWIIGKIITEAKDNNVSNINTLNCKFKDDKAASEACTLFKIDETVDDIKNITTTNIKDSTTTKTDYAKDKYFVIDLKKSTKKDISDFNQKTIIVTESNNTEVAQFSFVSALLDDGVFSTTSKTIILS